MKQHAKTGMMLWTLEGDPVQTFYERLGGTLAGEKNYAVADIKVTEVVRRRDDIDQLIQELGKTKRSVTHGNANETCRASDDKIRPARF